MQPVRRFLLKKFLAPLSFSRHTPEYNARGTAVGLAIAFTPTVGIQMPIVFAFWVLTRNYYPKWEFNLLVALAWTWVTNVFTLAPVYFVFLFTGRVIMARWENLAGFDTFYSKFSASINSETGLFDPLWGYIINLFDQFGLPLFIGSLPWAFLLSWLGYFWSLSFIQHIRKRRELRRSR